MKKKVKKVHFFNNVYAKKNRYKNPKEIFVYLIKLLKKQKLKKNTSVLDVGCSNGELLFNLNKNFKNFKLSGIDIDQKLLKKAQKICPKNIFFKRKNISKKIKNIGKFDIVILSGVLSIFDNGEKIIKNLLYLLKPKGQIYIFDSVNVNPFNLYIKSENIKNNKKIVWYQNMYSVEYIKKISKKLKKKCKFFQFRLKSNIKKNKKNLSLRWTEILSGKKIITSGIGMIENQFWIKIY